MSYEDKTLQCRDCGAEFVFTAGEQEFYTSHELKNEPGRCPECRSARRRRAGGGFDAARGGRPAVRQMHPVVCATCGVETEVPFLPRNDKPVYCSACFDKVRSQR